jgi:hypothetical protein
MKLLIILPNLVLIAISGINLSNELSNTQQATNLAVMVLHFSVLIMCITFVALIIRSMFKVVATEDNSYAENTAEYEELDMRHTIQL